MGDMWDYRLRKLEMAWDLAMRLVPKAPEASGAWTPNTYLAKAQETLQKALDAVNAVFKETEA